MPRDGIAEQIQPSDAASIGYEPTTPADWTILPENVHEALDEARSAAGGGGGGSGDVVGPASAVDNALALFDGTTGKLIKEGTVTHPSANLLDNLSTLQSNLSQQTFVNDSGATMASILGAGTVVNYLQLRGSATGAALAIAAIGTDPNIGINLIPKGTGTLQSNGTDVLLNVVEDTTPQLGGMLDVNGQSLGDGTNKLLSFVEDGLAVNNLEIENEATGAGPILRAVGSDAVVDLHVEPKGINAELVVDSTETASYLYLFMHNTGAAAEIGTSGATDLDIGGAVENLKFIKNADAHIYGGTSSGNDLYLHSTSHATKGQVFFGATGAVTYNGVNGYLGVGTTNPTNAKLEIQGSTGVPLAWLEEDGNGANFQVYSHKTAAGGSSQFRMYKSRGSKASPTAVASGDQIGVLSFHGYDGSAYWARCQVRGDCDGTPVDSTNSVPTQFVVATGSTSQTKRLTIDSTGKAKFFGNISFNSKTPTTAPNYTRSGVGTNRSIDYVTSSTATVRQVLATLVQDLINIGLLQ